MKNIARELIERVNVGLLNPFKVSPEEMHALRRDAVEKLNAFDQEGCDPYTTDLIQSLKRLQLRFFDGRDADFCARRLRTLIQHANYVY